MDPNFSTYLEMYKYIALIIDELTTNLSILTENISETSLSII